MKDMIRKRNLYLIILCLVLASLGWGQKKIKESELPPKYQEWLNLTAYIILPQEKDVFLRLSTDFERDVFIDSFWKQRDPTPGTPENEYKEEIQKRTFALQKEMGLTPSAYRRGQQPGETSQQR